MQQVESTSLKVTLTYRDGIAKLTLVQSLRRNAIGAEKSATIETLLLEFNRDFGSGAYMTHMMNNGFLDLLGFILQVFSIANDHGPLATLASSFPKKVKNSLRKLSGKPCFSFTVKEETKMTPRSSNLYLMFQTTCVMV